MWSIRNQYLPHKLAKYREKTYFLNSYRIPLEKQNQMLQNAINSDSFQKKLARNISSTAIKFVVVLSDLKSILIRVNYKTKSNSISRQTHREQEHLIVSFIAQPLTVFLAKWRRFMFLYYIVIKKNLYSIILS